MLLAEGLHALESLCQVFLRFGEEHTRVPRRREALVSGQQLHGLLLPQPGTEVQVRRHGLVEERVVNLHEKVHSARGHVRRQPAEPRQAVEHKIGAALERGAHVVVVALRGVEEQRAHRFLVDRGGAEREERELEKTLADVVEELRAVDEDDPADAPAGQGVRLRETAADERGDMAAHLRHRHERLIGREGRLLEDLVGDDGHAVLVCDAHEGEQVLAGVHSPGRVAGIANQNRTRAHIDLRLQIREVDLPVLLCDAVVRAPLDVEGLALRAEHGVARRRHQHVAVGVHEHLHRHCKRSGAAGGHDDIVLRQAQVVARVLLGDGLAGVGETVRRAVAVALLRCQRLLRRLHGHLRGLDAAAAAREITEGEAQRGELRVRVLAGVVDHVFDGIDAVQRRAAHWKLCP
eukprot:PhM_4_TR15764/c0_g1_i1/m.96230